jgi:hypothetical protein
MKFLDTRYFPWLMFAPYAMLTLNLPFFLHKVMLGVYSRISCKDAVLFCRKVKFGKVT